MKLKNNETLAFVANYCQRPAAELANAIIDGLIKAGFLTDEPKIYGLMLSEAISGNATVFSVTETIKQALAVPVINSTLWDKVCGCVVMGDGDCPECGGELRFVETEGHEINDGDRLTPNSYEIDKYVYICPVCGSIVKTTKEL